MSGPSLPLLSETGRVVGISATSTGNSSDNLRPVCALNRSVEDDASVGSWAAAMFRMLAEPVPKRQCECRPWGIESP